MTLNPNSKKWLKHHFGDNVRFNEPMSAHTSFKVGGPAAAYVVPERPAELFKLVERLRKTPVAYLVVGDGTNLLVKDEGIPAVVISLKRCLNKISLKERRKNRVRVDAMAGVKLGRLCSYALNKGLKGMNFALGIPGTVGGAIMMNAGSIHGWMENVLDAVTVITPSGEKTLIAKDKLNFSYRTLSWKVENLMCNLGRPVIIQGSFNLLPADSGKLKEEARKILYNRKSSQPTRLPSAGCFFKNPPGGRPAGELIEMAGLKGKRIGGAEVSTRHANFIVNKKNARAADILSLMEHVQRTVTEKYNIRLEAEVKIVGEETYSQKLL